MANPKFVIEKRGKTHVVVWRNDGVRPASDVEVSLWKQLQRTKAKLRKMNAEIDRVLEENAELAEEVGK